MNSLTSFLILLISATALAFTVQSPSKNTFHRTIRKETGKNNVSHHVNSQTILKMSFYADSSDYKPSESDYTSDDEAKDEFGVPVGNDEEGGEDPSIEESPVPMSKNSGNRFVALVFDKSLTQDDDVNVMDLHEKRIELTEDHVMFCRKANLYNETFNADSMSDIVWSHQILASDMGRTIGHAMCIESTTVQHAKETLAKDPIVQHLTGGDIESIPFYRWRHIRDHALRQDDGRNGSPTLMVALDRAAEDGVADLRERVRGEHLEYLFRSERVIAAGPLHLPTEFKDDPSSLPIGDLILFNAPDREDAINFVENDPSAKAGLYDSMKVYRYNSLDVTGKFVATNLMEDKKNKPTADMKEAMEYWEYPVGDRQTKWLNW